MALWLSLSLCWAGSLPHPGTTGMLLLLLRAHFCPCSPGQGQLWGPQYHSRICALGWWGFLLFSILLWGQRNVLGQGSAPFQCHGGVHFYHSGFSLSEVKGHVGWFLSSVIFKYSIPKGQIPFTNEIYLYNMYKILRHLQDLGHISPSVKLAWNTCGFVIYYVLNSTKIIPVEISRMNTAGTVRPLWEGLHKFLHLKVLVSSSQLPFHEPMSSQTPPRKSKSFPSVC